MLNGGCLIWTLIYRQAHLGIAFLISGRTQGVPERSNYSVAEMPES